jgi:hypothetical protein
MKKSEKILSYADQIKHPEWQKKRLEILNRDEFTCQQCGNKEQTLHVHHKHYNYGAKIWEYQAWELTTLCETCHSKTHENKDVNVEYPEEITHLIEVIYNIAKCDTYYGNRKGKIEIIGNYEIYKLTNIFESYYNSLKNGTNLHDLVFNISMINEQALINKIANDIIYLISNNKYLELCLDKLSDVISQLEKQNIYKHELPF